MTRPWDFRYVPVPTSAGDDDGGPCDLVVATAARVPLEALLSALAPLLPGASACTLIDRAPLHWSRVTSTEPARRADVATALTRAGIPVRYVASARCESTTLGPRLEASRASPSRARSWRARPRREPANDSRRDSLWFLRGEGGGISADREACGTGAGTRLAVIDDDASQADQLDLDREVLLGIERPPRAIFHGSLMIAWAVGTAHGFAGVAPDASPRLYCIPKPGADVVFLPLAIARATFDGADVILCSTFVERATSPMLDDALDVAARLGRRGRGAPVVMPTGRQTSSPGNSMHASLTLGFGEPASDPRVMCVAPGGRAGGWFLWRDRRGRFRPFANRGPAIRWLAPGDDMAYPFASDRERFHSESSGASAIAAGVVLLTLANNPTLRAAELERVLARTVSYASPVAAMEPLADPCDVEPESCDRDGHNAKSGYGLLDATRACLSARDPITASLVAIGEDDAAAAYASMHANARGLRGTYSVRFARWAVRAILADEQASHALRALLRHARLVAHDRRRSDAHGTAAFGRQLAVLMRLLASSQDAPRRSRFVELELRAHADAAARIGDGGALAGLVCELLAAVWRVEEDSARPFRAEALPA